MTVFLEKHVCACVFSFGCVSKSRLLEPGEGPAGRRRGQGSKPSGLESAWLGAAPKSADRVAKRGSGRVHTEAEPRRGAIGARGICGVV